jgi:hypothetical protein
MQRDVHVALVVALAVLQVSLFRATDASPAADGARHFHVAQSASCAEQAAAITAICGMTQLSYAYDYRDESETARLAVNRLCSRNCTAKLVASLQERPDCFPNALANNRIERLPLQCKSEMGVVCA